MIMHLLMWILSLFVATSSLEGKPALKILVVGRTGSGKSTLINNILGQELAIVGHTPNPQTREVLVYHREIEGVSVTACDTPGLGDASGQEAAYMKEIKTWCRNPDLVLFCLSMDNTRWHDDDEEAIKTVTEHLGKGIWDNSVLVLTFADKRIPCNESNFRKRISYLEKLFKSALRKVGISGNTIPSALSAKGHKDLPGVTNWFTKFMVTCLSKSKRGEGLRRLVLARLVFHDQVNEDDFKKPEHEQPITLTGSLCSLMKLNPGLWVGSISGGKAGGILATKLLGAKIGGIFGGPVGYLLGGIAGVSLEYIISSATCSDTQNRKEEL